MTSHLRGRNVTAVILTYLLRKERTGTGLGAKSENLVIGQ